MTTPYSRWDTPDLVEAALRESLRVGYLESTRSETGRFLATLAASRRGTIADLGTGSGVGAAWLRTGAPPGTRVVTVERDAALAASAARLFADTGVEVLSCDWSTLDWSAHRIDALSLITIDIGTAGGARERLVDLLAPGGFLVLDDLHSWRDFPNGRVDRMVLEAWKHESRLVCTELHVAPDASVLLCCRR